MDIYVVETSFIIAARNTVSLKKRIQCKNMLQKIIQMDSNQSVPMIHILSIFISPNYFPRYLAFLEFSYLIFKPSLQNKYFYHLRKFIPFL